MTEPKKRSLAAVNCFDHVARLLTVAQGEFEQGLYGETAATLKRVADLIASAVTHADWLTSNRLNEVISGERIERPSK